MKLDVASVCFGVFFRGEIDFAKLEETDGIRYNGWGDVCGCSKSNRKAARSIVMRDTLPETRVFMMAVSQQEWLVDAEFKNDGEDGGTRYFIELST